MSPQLCIGGFRDSSMGPSAPRERHIAAREFGFVLLEEAPFLKPFSCLAASLRSRTATTVGHRIEHCIAAASELRVPGLPIASLERPIRLFVVAQGHGELVTTGKQFGDVIGEFVGRTAWRPGEYERVALQAESITRESRLKAVEIQQLGRHETGGKVPYYEAELVGVRREGGAPGFGLTPLTENPEPCQHPVELVLILRRQVVQRIGRRPDEFQRAVAGSVASFEGPR